MRGYAVKMDKELEIQFFEEDI